MAANKEAIVIVLDVGHFMCKNFPDSTSPLQDAKTCIGMILQRKIFSESKDEIALVFCGTNETDNPLARLIDDEYKNISIKSNLKPASWDMLQCIQNTEGTTNTTADYVDALIVAMDLLTQQTLGQKFASQRILLFSNFVAAASNDQMDTIIKGLRNSNMQLNIIGPTSITEDSDSEDEQSTDKLKNYQTPKNSVIKCILKEVNGEAYSFSEALPALTFYQKKAVQPAGWNATLEISSKLKLPITGYVKITPYKSKGWKMACAIDPNVNIQKESSYHMNDEAQTEVKKEDTIIGYRYGTTLIPFSEEDKLNMAYKATEKGIKVLGFTKEDNIKYHHFVGDKVTYIVGQKDNEAVEKALSAFIQALYETSMVSVARYVYSASSAPKLGFLAPRIKKEYECLVFIQLPFMEDLRHYTFSPLDGNAKNLPTEDQLSAIGDLITAMDLSIFTRDDDNDYEEELLKSSQTINPYLQRYFQCLQHCVFKPGTPIPEMPSYISNILKTPQKINDDAKPILEKLKKLFPTEEVIPSKAIKTGVSIFQNGDKSEVPTKRNRTGSESLQTMADLVVGTVEEVGTVTPVDDFKKLVTSSNCNFTEVCKQLQNVILKLIKDPLGGNLHVKAINCLKVYREESLKKLEPSEFNAFMKELKAFLTSSHKQLWQQITSEKICLINNKDCKRSDVSVTEAEQFFVIASENKAAITDEENEDEEDLLAQM